MKLICYALHDDVPRIVPAPPTRGWMDEFTGKHPYKCLPLAIGNCYGWQLLLRARVQATWTGGMGAEDVIVETPRQHTAKSNFQRGVLTFDVPVIFRTDPGYHLLVTGPTNEFKDGVAPMFAMIEAEWLNYTFTMNYQFTRPCTVTWEEGEPFCQVFVVPSGTQETVEPEWRNIRTEPEIKGELEMLTKIRDISSAAGVQKYYFQGKHPADGRIEPSHQTKMRLRELKDYRT